MRDVINWVKAVWDHWIWLLTGSIIAAGIGVGEHYTGSPVGWGWYATLIGVALLSACFRAWQAEHQALKCEQDKHNAASLPNIVLAPNGLRVETRYLGQGGNITTPLSCLNAYFMNDPQFSTERSVARDITSTIVYREKASGTELFSLNGRWGDTQQPRTASEVQTSVHLLPTDFPIGVTRELNLAFKHPPDQECYGFSNQTYGSPDWRAPQWRLSGEEFIVEVRLRGPYVDRSWTFDFRNPGAGTELQILDTGSSDMRS